MEQFNSSVKEIKEDLMLLRLEVKKHNKFMDKISLGYELLSFVVLACSIVIFFMIILRL